MSYLAELTMQLGAGLGQWGEPRRARHAAWLWAQQHADGGFCGREGASDLYYTSFALRALAILGELDSTRGQPTANFLKSRMQARESIVDAFSLIYSAALLDAAAGIDVFADTPETWRSNVAAWCEQLRRPDGGYAKGQEGIASSTYQTFLVLVCLQLLDLPIPDPDSITGFLLQQRSDEGGFREIRASKRGGTNPTAAAIGALQILNRLTDDLRQDVTEFVLDMQTDEGGLRANTRIPIADLLSTFTGLWTLHTLGTADEIDTGAIRRFALALEEPTGGFRGAELDFACDVEYSFYGLGVLGLVGPP